MSWKSKMIMMRQEYVFLKDYKEGGVREGFIEYQYLFILMKLCPGHQNNELKRMNINVDKDNGKAAGMVNGRYLKGCLFSSN